jgi:uncharacterized protein
MSRETAARALDLAFSLAGQTAAPSRKLTLGFFGGEPLMEWPLLQWAHGEALARAREHGVALVFTLTTNLTLLDEPKAAWLVGNEIALGLSLDGNAAMHDAFRVYPDGSGSHADCLRALRLLSGRGAKGEIICVVHPATVRHLADAVKELSDAFGFTIAINPDFSAGWDDAARAELARQYNRVGDLILARYRAGAPVSVNVFDGKIITHLLGGYRDCDRCSMGTRELAVAVSGNLYPCARLVGGDDHADLCLGDVRRGLDPAALMRITLRRGNHHPACAACPLQARCMNWCGCVNYVSSGDIGEVGAFTCFHEKTAIAVADRVADALWREQNPAFLSKFYSSVPSV